MKVILNADDFGYDEDSVLATIELIQRGCLTSATILLGCPGTDLAVKFALSDKSRGISYGLHLGLVGDGVERSISNSFRVRGILTDRDGRFKGSNRLRFLSLCGLVPIDAIHDEVISQFNYLECAGVPISHFDSHGHLHKFPLINHVISGAMSVDEFRYCRRTQDVFIPNKYFRPTRILSFVFNQFIEEKFLSTDHLYMPECSAKLNVEEITIKLKNLFSKSKSTLEIGVHPGFSEAWRLKQYELAISLSENANAWCDFINWNELKLCRHYG